jgi:hypothetical protein
MFPTIYELLQVAIRAAGRRPFPPPVKPRSRPYGGQLQAALDSDMFWRAHRSYLVNVNRIREVVPWFKSTYQLRMGDKKASEIPVSRLQSRKLREMLNL